MAIDLKAALKRKLEPTGGDLFKFEVPGVDQLIFRFGARRTVIKDGRASELIEADVLAGEKGDPATKKSKPVKPGKMVFFLSTHARQIFDREKPEPGDVWQLQLSAIRADLRNMKEFAHEILERVPRPKVVTIDDDDIPVTFAEKTGATD